jgi:hypothetical protein
MSTAASGSIRETLTRVDARGHELAKKQALFRAVNEQIRALANGWDLAPELDLVCECGSDGCLSALAVPAATYENVRRFPTRFIVRPGHEVTEYERIVDDGDAFVVVEKVGVGAADAIRYAGVGNGRRRRRSG